MDEDLHTLAGRVERLMSISERLADEVKQLRRDLETAQAGNQNLLERMEQARQRVESALAKMPDNAES
jgi:uncharacterized protein (TIGR02449 family)